MRPVEFTVVPGVPPVGGRLRYVRPDLAFDFRPGDPPEVWRAEDAAGRAEDAVELVFGTIALAVDRDGGHLLGAWGYHPDAGWLSGALGSPTTSPGRLAVTLDRVPRPGVCVRLARADELTTIRDGHTGWIRVGRTGVPTGTRFVEFATGCLAELADRELVALWLRPAPPDPSDR